MNEIDKAIGEYAAAVKKRDWLKKQGEALERRIKYLEEVAIPSLMTDAGTDKFRSLAAGLEVTVKETPVASCPAPSATDPELVARRKEIFEWLDGNGYGHIVKRQVQVFYTEDEEVAAASGKRTHNKVVGLIREIKALGDDEHVKCSHAIHASTFKKFVREASEEGILLPPCFKPEVITKAVFKAVKS